MASSEVVQYQWDYCLDDLLNTPQVNITGTIPNVSNIGAIELLNDQGVLYGFVPGRSDNHLYRLTFEGDSESAFHITDLGDLNGKLSQPKNLKFIRQEHVWYAIVVNVSNSIVRLKFAGGLLAQPEAENLGNFGNISAPIGLDLVKDGDKIVALVSSYSSGVTTLDFGTDITSIPTPYVLDVIPVSGSSGIAIYLDTDLKWRGLIGSYNTNEIYKLEFENGLFANPVVSEIADFHGPTEIRAIKEADKYYFFAVNQLGSLMRIVFDGHIKDIDPQITDLGNFGKMVSLDAFDIIKEGATWHGITIRNNSGEVYNINFPNSCAYVSITSSEGREPEVPEYYHPGEYWLSQTVVAADAEQNQMSKQVTVIDKPGAVVTMDWQGACVGRDVVFQASSSKPGSSFEWEVDNANVSGQQLLKTFDLPGVKSVKLQAIDTDGCKTILSEEIPIFSPPQADFEIQSGVLCTHGEISFTNTTTDMYDGLLQYQWYVNNNSVATSRDMQHTFNDVGVFTIKLKTSIPGCYSEKSKTTSSIEPGPEVSFSMEGGCEADSIYFISNASENVSDYQWSFGDGATSSERNPYHIFSGHGDFRIMLEVLSESGCQIVIADTRAILPSPKADFHIATQSVFCSGSELLFEDHTELNGSSAISSWEWSFGDNAESTQTKNSTHTFANGGNFLVSLEVSNTQGCSDMKENVVTVNASPSTDFEYTPACVNIPVNFNTTDAGISVWKWTIDNKLYTDAKPKHTFRTGGVHDLSIEVTANNGCVGSENTSLDIPFPLSPDFSVAKNCVGQRAVFSDITVVDNDPVKTWLWQVDGKDVDDTDNEFQMIFNNDDQHMVSLDVKTESGCSYSVSKDVAVVLPPKAGFIVSSDIGSPPFSIDFTNRSSESNHFNWNFGDGATASDESPEHIFNENGEFTVVLEASNDQGCSDQASHLISISKAAPDVTIMAITTSENSDGSVKVVVIIENEGNTILQQLPVDIDVSGKINLREIIADPLMPGARANLALGYGVDAKNITFICANADLEGDVSPQSNRNCVDFEKQPVVFMPIYPNPVKAWLNIEWISANTNPVHASVYNTFGNMIMDYSFESQKGLNKKDVNVTDLQKGVYLLILEANGIKTTQRILLTR